jgi:hypothetical protein
MTPSATIQARTFSGHESFPLRFTWLTKAVRGCEAKRNQDLFARPDAMVLLGVGKNMVRSIRFWAVNTGVLEDAGADGRTTHYRPSPLGAFLFGNDGHDPFIEDPATVWLLHWQLATRQSLGTWFWIFNELREVEFHKATIIRDLQRTIQRDGGKPIATDTIERDVDCLLRTYVPSDPDKRLSREELLDCPLTELGLIRRGGDRDSFSFLRGDHDSLPDRVFAYAVLSFWDTVAPKSNSLRFEQIAFSPGGPGQVFKLTENVTVDRLQGLAHLTDGVVRFDETAGGRHLLRDRRADPLTQLRKNYTTTRKEARFAGSR